MRDLSSVAIKEATMNGNIRLVKSLIRMSCVLAMSLWISSAGASAKMFDDPDTCWPFAYDSSVDECVSCEAIGAECAHPWECDEYGVVGCAGCCNFLAN